MEELETLVRRARAGERTAYDHLVRQFQSSAISKARQLLGDYHLAEDAVQEAFVAAYQDLVKLRDAEAFPSWLLRIVAHRCNRLRRGATTRTSALSAASETTSAEPTPDQLLETGQLRERIDRAIADLPAPEHQVFTLFYLNDLSQKDIADLLNIPVSTANSRLYTSRKRLRKEFAHMDHRIPFVHLHSLSEHSSDHYCRIDERAEHAAAYAMPALALTDSNNLFGAVHHQRSCQQNKIKSIIGCQLDIASHYNAETLYPIVLLARDKKGYHNLIKLISKAHLESPNDLPHVEMATLAKYHTGLFCLSGGSESEICQLIAAGHKDRATVVADLYKDLFADAYYLEIQRHGAPREEQVNTELIALANKASIPLVATHPFRFLDRAEYAHMPALSTDAIRPSLFMKNATEMRDLFADLPMAFANAARIAEQCHFDLQFDSLNLPAFSLPGQFPSADEFLRNLAFSGLARRLSEANAQYTQRLEHELEVVAQLGFATYFLIVGDYARHARQQHILIGPGRGTSASSLLNYCLEITDIDPIAHHLHFARFLNSARHHIPDIDLDIAPSRRDELVDYIVQRYGTDCVSRVTALGTTDAHRALRQVGRALNMDADAITAVINLVPDKNIPLQQAVDQSCKLQRMLKENGPQAQLLTHARRLVGLVQRKEHVASLLVAPSELSNHVPLYRTETGRIATQYDARTCEEINLLKVDLLALRELDVLEEMARQTKVEIHAIPTDDEATFSLLQSGNSAGIFALNDALAQDHLRRLAPNRFGHLVDLFTMHHPGAMNQLDEYIERRHQRNPTTAPHPTFAPSLTTTYGLLLYQEQLMLIAENAAGISDDEADLLRRALPRTTALSTPLPETKREHIEKLRRQFVAGCEKNGRRREEADELWAVLCAHSSALFNHSHAVSYAHITYWMAYFKTHYPQNFQNALSAN